MKFKIQRYYDRYTIQVLTDDFYNSVTGECGGKWVDIGLPNGYQSVKDAKNHCRKYKEAEENKIVEIFEL